MDGKMNGSEVMAASENIPELQTLPMKKCKVADDSTECSPLMDRKLNIRGTVVNGEQTPSHRARLPQPLVKKMKLTATVDNTDLAMVVTMFDHSNGACNIASNKKWSHIGSGKTFIMQGPDDLTSESMEMIPRAVDQILTAQQLKATGWTLTSV